MNNGQQSPPPLSSYHYGSELENHCESSNNRQEFNNCNNGSNEPLPSHNGTTSTSLFSYSLSSYTYNNNNIDSCNSIDQHYFNADSLNLNNELFRKQYSLNTEVKKANDNSEDGTNNSTDYQNALGCKLGGSEGTTSKDADVKSNWSISSTSSDH